MPAHRLPSRPSPWTPGFGSPGTTGGGRDAWPRGAGRPGPAGASGRPAHRMSSRSVAAVDREPSAHTGRGHAERGHAGGRRAGRDPGRAPHRARGQDHSADPDRPRGAAAPAPRPSPSAAQPALWRTVPSTWAGSTFTSWGVVAGLCASTLASGPSAAVPLSRVRPMMITTASAHTMTPCRMSPRMPLTMPAVSAPPPVSNPRSSQPRAKNSSCGTMKVVSATIVPAQTGPHRTRSGRVSSGTRFVAPASSADRRGRRRVGGYPVQGPCRRRPGRPGRADHDDAQADRAGHGGRGVARTARPTCCSAAVTSSAARVGEHRDRR